MLEDLLIDLGLLSGISLGLWCVGFRVRIMLCVNKVESRGLRLPDEEIILWDEDAYIL